MNRDETIGLQVTPIDLEGFAGQEVDRHRIAGEGVEYDDVVADIVGQLLQLQAGIADDGLFGSRPAVGNIVEPSVGDPHRFWIDLVEVVFVGFAGIGGQRLPGRPPCRPRTHRCRS